MDQAFGFLVEHGYLVLFAAILAEQAGLPVPSLPFLLGAGALAASGELSFVAAVALVVVASLIPDWAWYELGRRRGVGVLGVLCRISLEPDSCVRRTQNLFARHGARALLVSKFVPALNTAAPPLAGVFGMRLGWFLLYDVAGAAAWGISLIGVGWLFADQLERIVETAARLGGSLALVAAIAFALWLAWKFVQRQRFLRELRIARITPQELKRKIDEGEDVVVVDLRHAVEFEADPETLPGALRMTPEQIEQASGGLPRERDIVFFCT